MCIRDSFSYAQETEHLSLQIALTSETRLDKVRLHRIPGFESYLASVSAARCDESNGPAELQALEATVTDTGIDLIPRTLGLNCSVITLELELPRLAVYHVLGLADIQVVRAPYPSGTVTLSWLGSGDDGLEGTATTQSVYASCEGQNSTQLNALVLGAPTGAYAPERVVIPGDYLTTTVPCDSFTELTVSTCDEVQNCSESALRISWDDGTITGIETADCPAP